MKQVPIEQAFDNIEAACQALERLRKLHADHKDELPDIGPAIGGVIMITDALFEVIENAYAEDAEHE